MTAFRVALALILAALVVAGLLTGDTGYGFAALAVVGAAWLVRDFRRGLHGGAA